MKSLVFLGDRLHVTENLVLTVYENDLQLAKNALDGNEEAASEIRGKVGLLISRLLDNKADHTTAQDIANDVISSCFGGHNGNPTLAQYRGESTLNTWLIRSAERKLIDVRKSARSKTTSAMEQEELEQIRDRSEKELGSTEIRNLVFEGLKKGFDSADPTAVVFIMLKHRYNVNQRDLGHCWQMGKGMDSQISKQLKKAYAHIKEVAIEHVQSADPDLVINWEDMMSGIAEYMGNPD